MRILPRFGAKEKIPDNQKTFLSKTVFIMRTFKHYPLLPLAALTLHPLRKNTPESTLSLIKEFLQGQLTCDMNNVSPTQSRWFSHCNLQGQMMTLGRIIQSQDSYWLIIPKSIADTSRSLLEKYASFSRLEVRSVPDLDFFGLSADFLPEHFPSELYAASTFNQTVLICVQTHPYRWLSIQEKSSDFLSKLNLETFTEKDWLAEEIRVHSPFLTPETVGKFLPHDIDLPQKLGVSFQKGCFLGQEIIARMEHLGKLKRKMMLKTWDPLHPLPEDSEVICSVEENEKQIGLVSTHLLFS